MTTWIFAMMTQALSEARSEGYGQGYKDGVGSQPLTDDYQSGYKDGYCAREEQAIVAAEKTLYEQPKFVEDEAIGWDSGDECDCASCRCCLK